jgi:hypothetical protein
MVLHELKSPEADRPIDARDIPAIDYIRTGLSDIIEEI